MNLWWCGGEGAGYTNCNAMLSQSEYHLLRTYPLELNFKGTRDPAQHEALAAQIEQESTAYYASARLWDDGIIKPVDTRDTLGLALALSSRERGGARSGGSGHLTTWDGDRKGFGVFRM